MFAYAVENRLRRWFTGDVHIKFMTINIPQKAAQILRTLNAAPGNCMVSKELQRLVVEKTGCSESTYNHARSALSGDGLIKNVRQIVPEVGVCGVTALTQSTAVA